MIRVAFLLDKSNDWLAENIPQHFNASTKFEFYKIYNEREVKNFDIVFVLGYTKLLQDETLESNEQLLVVHESDLPKGRGFAPMQWQILDGKNNITVCLLKVSSEADKGDIYEKMIISLDGTELYDELRIKQAKTTFELIECFLKKFPDVNLTKQVGEPTTYRRRKPSDSELDVDQTIRNQFNLLRICNNNDWPAFFEIAGVKYKLKIEKIR